MGMGDEILATGEARYAHENDAKHRRVRILDINGNPRWHALWEGNPRLAKPHESGDFIEIKHAAYCRPYVDWDRMRADFAKIFPNQPFRTKRIRDPRLPWRYTDAKCKRGELYCFKRLPKQNYVVIEPHNKTKNLNRNWGWDKWQAVVQTVDLDWMQINPDGDRLLKGVRHQAANTFLDACRLLSGARAYVGPEGGLYHAAAALGVPAVGLFGGFTSPDNQGYDDYVNLYAPMDGMSPCGQRVPCAHCQAAMERIKVEHVVDGVKTLLKEV